MKLVLDKPSYFKDSLSIIAKMVVESKFKVTNEGIVLSCMDAANICMITFRLLKSAFAKYELDGEVDLCVNISNLMEVMRKAKPSDLLTLELLEDKRLSIQLKGKSTRRFAMPTIEMDDNYKEPPAKLDVDATVKMSSILLSESIDFAKLGGSEGCSVEFTCTKDKVILKSEDAGRDSCVEIKADKETSIKCESEVVCKYPSEYLSRIMESSKISDNVFIQYKVDYPLQMEFKVPDKMSLGFILAPRVEID